LRIVIERCGENKEAGSASVAILHTQSKMCPLPAE
jgi:hypothetical protein